MAVVDVVRVIGTVRVEVSVVNSETVVVLGAITAVVVIVLRNVSVNVLVEDTPIVE